MPESKTYTMRGRNKPLEQIKIARERISILFEEAESAAKKKKTEYANRYVHMARRIGMRYNVRIPSNLRRKFCRRCKKFLYPGLSSMLMEEKNFLRVECLNCGKIMKYKVA